MNNAGFGHWGLFGRADVDRYLAMVQVNIVALMQLTRLVLPRMVSQRRGRILNVASTAGFAPGPLMAVYYASKAFVVSFSEAIAPGAPGNRNHGHRAVPGSHPDRVRRRGGNRRHKPVQDTERDGGRPGGRRPVTAA